MSFYDDIPTNQGDNNWIYIGGDISNLHWSKVGKTTNGLNTRHTSSQNPDYFIYAAFQIIRGSVHEIELKLLKHIESKHGLKRISHFSTGNPSECFYLNPDEMTYLVEQFIQNEFGSCVTYENCLHGEMSRYQCNDDIRRNFQDDGTPKPTPFMSKPSSLGRGSYFTGNQETYEIDLGDGHYLDVASGREMYRDEAEENKW